jgi:hypothetical protein
MAEPQKVEVVNHANWGAVVKDWARGTKPIPKSLDEFKDQLAAANVGMKIPANFKNVQFVQGSPETLVVKLPCRTFMEAGEKRLAQEGGDYALPAFYERVFGKKPSIEDKMQFHAERIGDYSIAMCN